MSEPRRMLDEGGDDIGLSLLRSARDDAPSPGARRKTLVALGLATSVGATAVSASTSASAALLKWIGVGVLGGAVAVGAVTVVQSAASSRVSHETPTETVAVSTAVAPRVAQRGVAPTVEPTAAPEADPAPPAPEPSVAPVDPPRAMPSTRPSLADEVAALDAARAALAAGDNGGALRALDDHDRRFPGGALGPEALVVRIQALAGRGDRAAATRLGNAYLEAHPNGVHAARVRSLIGAPAPASEAPAP